MSVSVVTGPDEADSVGESHALAFRIAFATSVGFTLGYLAWLAEDSTPDATLGAGEHANR